jgi:hypothetical protein
MSWKPIAKFWVPVFGELDLVLVPSGPGIRLNYVKFTIGDPPVKIVVGELIEPSDEHLAPVRVSLGGGRYWHC